MRVHDVNIHRHVWLSIFDVHLKYATIGFIYIPVWKLFFIVWNSWANEDFSVTSSLGFILDYHKIFTKNFSVRVFPLTDQELCREWKRDRIECINKGNENNIKRTNYESYSQQYFFSRKWKWSKTAFFKFDKGAKESNTKSILCSVLVL